jgi:FKBP-type peptidyl-prolyl cis-trans isomerase SlpA
MTAQVKGDSEVLVHFTLKLEDGTTAESTRGNGKPALFRLGDGSLSEPLEAQLLGLSAGDKCSFTLQPEAAFGEENPDLVQFFSRRDFTETGVPDAGTIMLFTAVNGSEMPGVVREVAEDSITVDFNHPLAGHPVIFDIEVLEIDPQQEETHANIAG